MSNLKEGEYVGHEVYFPDDDPPQEVIDRLKHYGFCQSKDGFYISREELEVFKTIAAPYKVGIMQDNIILGGGDPFEKMDQLLDMINQLKDAGVQGIDKYIEKIKRYP
ncbi:hypothetical protein ES703_60487 [subsurface metagenome]